jgi:anti-anti-sigma regulatory factor
MSQCVYKQDSLVFAVEQCDGTATICWKGVSDGRFPGQFLNPLIQEWAEKLKDVEVTVDLRQLEYMNSATVWPLLNLVKRLDANGKPVRVVFLDVEWQRIHGNCMSAIARTLKNVRVERQLFAEHRPLSTADGKPAVLDPSSGSN